MRAVVVGAGAVGLGVGSALVVGGADCVFVRRKGGSRALEREGLVRTGLFGEVRLPPSRFRVVDDVATAAADPADWILVCTKSFASEQVARDVAAAGWRGAPRVALFQNGWGNAERFAARIDPTRVWSARVITGFVRPRPNEVEVTVHADAIRVGSLFGEPACGAADLCRTVAAGGIPCEPSDTIGRDLWAKLLYNGALNPLGALLRVPYGELGRRPTSRAVMDAVVREIFAVMTAAGWSTHWPDADAFLAELYDRLLPATAEHESSMLQDLREGRRTEIDALSGAVVELAARHGVDARCNLALRDLVRAIEG